MVNWFPVIYWIGTFVHARVICHGMADRVQTLKSAESMFLTIGCLNGRMADQTSSPLLIWQASCSILELPVVAWQMETIPLNLHNQGVSARQKVPVK